MFSFSDELISDLFKDATGFRPGASWMEKWVSLSDVEKQEEWDYLCRTLEDNLAQEKIDEARAIERFEMEIDQLIDTGAGDRETAVRWFLQSVGLFGDEPGYIRYRLGLPYSYEGL